MWLPSPWGYPNSRFIRENPSINRKENWKLHPFIVKNPFIRLLNWMI
jgi:hypothetical protein